VVRLARSAGLESVAAWQHSCTSGLAALIAFGVRASGLGAGQQVSRFHALMPSRMAIAAKTSAAIGSAQDHPNRLLTTRPTSSTAERYEHSRVCFESATADADPSSRPARRCDHDSRAAGTKAIMRLAVHNAGDQALIYLVLKDAATPTPTATEFRETMEYAKDVLKLRDTYKSEGSLR
jgi:hypothetical protein